MGSGSSSSNTQTIDTTSAVNAMTNNIMNCQSNTLVTQQFLLTGNYNNISNYKQVQYLKLSSSCSQDAQSMQNLQQQVTSALQAAASAQSQALIGVLGSSQSDINQKISNDVQQNITTNTVNNIVSNTNASQISVISGNNNIVNNFSQSQTQSLLFDNCQKAINSLSSVQTINNATKGTSNATQSNPIADILNSIFSGLTSLSFTYVILIIAIIGGVVFFGSDILHVLFGDSDEGKKNRELVGQMMQQQFSRMGPPPPMGPPPMQLMRY